MKNGPWSSGSGGESFASELRFPGAKADYMRLSRGSWRSLAGLVALAGLVLYKWQLVSLDKRCRLPVASRAIGNGKVYVEAYRDHGALHTVPVLGLLEALDEDCGGFTYVLRHRCGTNRWGVDKLRDLPIDEMEVFENGFVTYVRPRHSGVIIATFDCSKK